MKEFAKHKNKRVNKDWLYNNKTCLNCFNQIEGILGGGLISKYFNGGFTKRDNLSIPVT